MEPITAARVRYRGEYPFLTLTHPNPAIAPILNGCHVYDNIGIGNTYLVRVVDDCSIQLIYIWTEADLATFSASKQEVAHLMLNQVIDAFNTFGRGLFYQTFRM